MALTKHQKLARAMKRFSDALDTHYQKTASMLNVLQLHFYETHLIIGRLLMSEKTLGTMMRTHRWAMESAPQAHEGVRNELKLCA